MRPLPRAEDDPEGYIVRLRRSSPPVERRGATAMPQPGDVYRGETSKAFGTGAEHGPKIESVLGSRHHESAIQQDLQPRREGDCRYARQITPQGRCRERHRSAACHRRPNSLTTTCRWTRHETDFPAPTKELWLGPGIAIMCLSVTRFNTVMEQIRSFEGEAAGAGLNRQSIRHQRPSEYWRSPAGANR
jgi:hypothetical protein